LAEFNELMLTAVAIRRNIDTAKLRQGRESARLKIPPPLAPAAGASAEALPAPSGPALVVKAEQTAMDTATGVGGKEREEGKRPRAESAGSSSGSSSSSAHASHPQEKKRMR